MTYAVIDVDGVLTIHSDPLAHDTINKVMPSGWWEMVRVKDRNLMAFVDESGVLTRQPRNPVGSVMLAVMGAATYAYAGPVVLAGWEEVLSFDDEGTEIRDLSESQVDRMTELHKWLNQILAGDDLGMPHQAAEVRKHAEWVRTLIEVPSD
jgi:cytochrome b